MTDETPRQAPLRYRCQECGSPATARICWRCLKIERLWSETLGCYVTIPED